MKRNRIRIFKIILLMTVLACVEINVYANYALQKNNIELSACQNNMQNSFNSDPDSFDVDQAIISNEPISLPEIQFQFALNSFVTTQYCFSIWQPPKIS